MNLTMPAHFRFHFVVILLGLLALAIATPAAAQVPLRPSAPLVPGTGVKLEGVGDDFEDATWSYAPKNPKSSEDIDGDTREAHGISKNKRIFESSYRGHPDVVQRVPTPASGIAGSKGALLMRTLRTGVPGKVSNKQQQDDLMVNVYGILGHEITPGYSPSATVRIHLPPWEKWEQRSGASFGFRMDCEAQGRAPVETWLGTYRRNGWHQYWPGMFIELQRKEDGFEKTHARLILRADESGADWEGPVFEKPGWYTLGISITPNGQVHYYASAGVDDLTEKDYLGSQFPYGLSCEKFNLSFFNVVNIDDGHTWSTPWIIDDPAIHYIPKGWTLAECQKHKELLAAKNAGTVSTAESKPEKPKVRVQLTAAEEKEEVRPARLHQPLPPRLPTMRR